VNTLPSSLLAAAAISLTPNIWSAERYTPGEPVRGEFKALAQPFLERHCYDCHDTDTKKGDLSLVSLGKVDESNAALWKSIWAQVSLQEMPPKKKSHVETIERLRFTDWIVGELQQFMKDKGGFNAHLDPQRTHQYRARLQPR
jgi:hypothetical protein